MINRTSASLSSVTRTDPIRVDSTQGDFGLNATIEVVSGTNTSDLEYTMDLPDMDPNNPTAAADNWHNATWFIDSTLTGVTATTTGKVDTNVTAVRLSCTAYTSGSVRLKVSQGDSK